MHRDKMKSSLKNMGKEDNLISENQVCKRKNQVMNFLRSRKGMQFVVAYDEYHVDKRLKLVGVQV